MGSGIGSPESRQSHAQCYQIRYFSSESACARKNLFWQKLDFLANFEKKLGRNFGRSLV